MSFSNLTIKLLFLFLPGIISVIIIDELTIHKRWEGFKYFCIHLP
jgi:hypothetical protein